MINTENGAKVANNIVDAMRGSPVLLAILLFNLIFVVVMYLAINSNRESIYGIQRTVIEQMAKNDERLHELVQNCMQGSRP
jgi:hypothetical protein